MPFLSQQKTYEINPFFKYGHKIGSIHENNIRSPS